ncbi:exo-beta-1,3-glucanase [Ceratobasidium sp. AG-Ba]|nr:exo-beta-1,3-glucanase [Ceratobasidium sp. AG-Ba]
MVAFKQAWPAFSLLLSTWLSASQTAFAWNCADSGHAKPHDPYWVETITRRGIAPYSDDPKNYQVYRNVKDFGAKGDGKTDDTAAIQRAISEGSRCGAGCQASTVTPALVYFPSGTYVISQPIAAYYYTSMVGNPKRLPTLLASKDFNGTSGVIDVDPYFPNNTNWYINQNNFFRSVRNFIIDTSQVPANISINGIHWQLSQATSLTNVRFEMSCEPGNNHQGVFIENGSGGFMSDLYFRGGHYGLIVGNQQFTVRNITLEKVQTGIMQLWNWAWTYQDVKIIDCEVGVNITSASTGSMLLVDTVVRDTPIFVATTGSSPAVANVTNTSNTTIILDNVTFKNVKTGMIDGNNTVLLSGGKRKTVKHWIQGNIYQGSSTDYDYSKGTVKTPRRSPKLIDSKGKFFSRRRPEYDNHSLEQFVSVMAHGAKGDGKHDDTKAIQKVLDMYGGCKIIYFDAGTYYVTDTIKIPEGTIVVGEVWSTIIGGGHKFADQKHPRAVIEVGCEGDTKPVQMSNLVLSTRSGSAGAIVLQWNVGEPKRQSDMSGMWDVHIRLGGFKGSDIQVDNCLATDTEHPVKDCTAAYMGLHLTKNAAVYIEGGWVWTADHDLDDPLQRQIDVYTGRGVFIESCSGPVWIVGGSSEHFAIYQYNIVEAKNVYLGLVQTESPYWQPTPAPPKPFSLSKAYKDPALTHGPAAWALSVTQSEDVYIYGAGFYNFFRSYNQSCLANYTCQETLVNIDKESDDIYVYSLATVGVTDMLDVNSKAVISQNDNRNGFQSNIAAWTSEKCSL